MLPLAFATVAALGASMTEAPARPVEVDLAAPAELLTNTTFVEDLAIGEHTVWVATRGGIEVYDRTTLGRRQVLTTREGLASNAVWHLHRDGAALFARSDRALCRSPNADVASGGAEDGSAGARFSCRNQAPRPLDSPAAAPALEGARVTVTRLLVGAGELVGTAGRGLWLRQGGGALRPLTSGGQICSNHMVAIAAWKGRTWFGSFDEGLCSRQGERFLSAAVPFRMVNDLAATADGLYVASSDGLWLTSDGERFERVAAVRERVITDLSYDEARHTLYATAANSLWRIPVGRSGRRQSIAAFYRPGGTRSLQAVEARDGAVWMAAEDRGAIRFAAGGFQVLDRAAGLPSSWGLDVAIATGGGAGGGVYLASLRDGLVRVDGNGSVHAVAGLPNPWLLHVSADSLADSTTGGALWVGTQGGAARLLGDGTVIAIGGLPDPRVHAVARIGADVWVATEAGTAIYR